MQNERPHNIEEPSELDRFKEWTIDDDHQLLQQTIYAEPAIKLQRRAHFDASWNKHIAHEYAPNSKPKTTIQPDKVSTPFSEFSSKGWKIHIAFPKGKERDVARFLYENGLYFKVEPKHGTYFIGARESGATIYVGSFYSTKQVAELVENNLHDFLTDGNYVDVNGKRMSVGSTTDIQLRPRVMARFDVAKTPLGWAEGNKKYDESGLPTWTGLGGIPILRKDSAEVMRVINNWNNYSPTQQQIYFERLLKRAYAEAYQELVKDFGETYLR